jgi:sterol desaturase/sphingolipid hydroxylase (fatty acid hydroxylase superfamily)
VGIALLRHAVNIGFGAAALAAAYAGGVLAWSAFEYATHRFLFHHTPATPIGVVVQYLIHGVHHAYPGDSRRWMIPVATSLPIAACLCVAAWLLGGMAVPGMAGFIHGYLAYDLIHHEVHRGANTTRLVRWLRANHMRHHYVAADRDFGVSSPLWDAVLRTKR